MKLDEWLKKLSARCRGQAKITEHGRIRRATGVKSCPLDMVAGAGAWIRIDGGVGLNPHTRLRIIRAADYRQRNSDPGHRGLRDRILKALGLEEGT